MSDAPELGPRPGDRVLVVTAHPDDVDFGAGGTIRDWTSQGVEVTYLLCTDGHQGGIDELVSRTDMRVIRQAEQRAAGRELGVTDLRFLGHDDGSLFPTLALRREIVRHIRDVKPRVLLTQSPERNWQRIFASHPDHMAAGEAAVQAVYPDSRNIFAFPELLDEGLQPWTVEELWVMAHPNPNVFRDVTEHFLGDAKTRQKWTWFIFYVVVGWFFYAEMKNLIARLAQLRQFSGQHEWLVTPRSVEEEVQGGVRLTV